MQGSHPVLVQRQSGAQAARPAGTAGDRTAEAAEARKVPTCQHMARHSAAKEALAKHEQRSATQPAAKSDSASTRPLGRDRSRADTDRNANDGKGARNDMNNDE